MTLKTRNRFNLFFSALSLFFLIFNIILVIYKVLNYDLFIPTPNHIPDGKTFLTSYNPNFVIAGLFLQMIYSCVIFFILYTVFEKTQSSEVIYFSVFNIAILLDSLRLWLVLFNMVYTYSVEVIFFQDIIIFARLLAPLALFLVCMMSEPEKRQSIEQNIFIVIVAAMVFGFFDPINTGLFSPNFCHVYAYQRTFHVASIATILGSIFWLYFNNRRKLVSNKITIGFALLSLGFFFITDASTLILLLIGHGLLYSGSFIYLKQLHNQYLWNY